MSKAWVVDGALWKLTEPLLPPWPDNAPGPRPVPDRWCLQEIFFVLHRHRLGGPASGTRVGSAMTCWRRLQRSHEAGVFDHVQQILLARLNAANRIDLSRAVLDGSHMAEDVPCIEGSGIGLRIGHPKLTGRTAARRRPVVYEQVAAMIVYAGCVTTTPSRRLTP